MACRSRRERGELMVAQGTFVASLMKGQLWKNFFYRSSHAVYPLSAIKGRVWLGMEKGILNTQGIHGCKFPLAAYMVPSSSFFSYFTPRKEGVEALSVVFQHLERGSSSGWLADLSNERGRCFVASIFPDLQLRNAGRSKIGGMGNLTHFWGRAGYLSDWRLSLGWASIIRYT